MSKIQIHKYKSLEKATSVELTDAHSNPDVGQVTSHAGTFCAEGSRQKKIWDYLGIIPKKGGGGYPITKPVL